MSLYTKLLVWSDPLAALVVVRVGRLHTYRGLFGPKSIKAVPDKLRIAVFLKSHYGKFGVAK